MKQETIFKVGDKVFDYNYGWGEVIGIGGKPRDIYPVVVDFDYVIMNYTLDGKSNKDGKPTLSFTEYTLEGFSQERPLPEIEKDTLIYVRDNGLVWYMEYFSHFGEKGKVFTYPNQETSKQTSITSSWNEYSLTNPLTEGITR